MGDYTEWEYLINDQQYISNNNGAYLDFTEYSAFQPIWKNKTAYSSTAQYYISSYDFTVYDDEGSIAAEMNDGVFESSTDDTRGV